MIGTPPRSIWSPPWTNTKFHRRRRMICWRSWSARRRTSSRSNSVDSDQPVNFDQFIATPRAASYKTSGPIVQPAEESVGKISLCTSQCSPCLRGASFLKQISTRRHGDHGVYTEKFDFSDRLRSRRQHKARGVSPGNESRKIFLSPRSERQ